MPIRFPATCLSSAAAVEPPFGSSSSTARGFGWRPSDWKRAVQVVADRRRGRAGVAGAPGGERRIALYFTGCKHAGENLAEVLKQRPPGLSPPIQMCDALSRNVPK